MKQAKISEFKNNLSRFLAFVRRGGTVRIYDRDHPVADLVPIPRGSGRPRDEEETLEELERAGTIRRGHGTLPPDFFTRALPRARRSVLEALLEERRGGR